MISNCMKSNKLVLNSCSKEVALQLYSIKTALFAAT